MTSKFRKYIHDKEVNPPADVWDHIEKELDKKSKKRLPFGLWMAALLLLIGISTISYFIWQGKSENFPQTENSTSNPTTNSSPQPTVEKENSNPNTNSVIEADNSSTSPRTTKNTTTPPSSDGHNTHTNYPNHRAQVIEKPVKASYQSPPKANSSTLKNTDEVSTASPSQPMEVAKSQKIKSDNIGNESLKPQDKPTSIDSMATLNTEITDTLALASSADPGRNSEPDQIMEIDTTSTDSIEETILKSKQDQSTYRWEFSSYIAPSYTRSASNKDIWLIDLYEYKGKYQNSENIGFGIQYNINPKWSVRSGAGFTNMRQKAYDVVVTTQPIIEGSSSSIDYFHNVTILNNSDYNINILDVSSMQEVDVEQHIQYLSIPVEFGYQLYDSKILNMSLYAGTSTHLLRKNSIRLFTDTQSSEFGEATNLNKIVMGTQLGIQSRFNLSKKVGFILEPRILYYFNTFNEKSEVRPFTFNLNTGLVFSF